MNSDLDAARRYLSGSRRVLVLTGAGMSAESGVPVFRGSAVERTAPADDAPPLVLSEWRGMPFEVLSSAEMVRRDLPLVWEWFDYRRSLVGRCEPNAGHTALAATAASGRFERFTIVTQNIDGFHGEAASRFDTTETIIELHGSIREARCSGCASICRLSNLPAEERPPVCPACGGAMRPNVVLFGEMLPVGAYEKAITAASACEVCLVVGTSGLVSPANLLPDAARAAGAAVIEINPDATTLTPFVDVSIRGTAAATLPALF